jgi:DNA-binding beta-propeller fold protein YncE
MFKIASSSLAWSLALVGATSVFLSGCASTPAAPEAKLKDFYAFWPPPPAEPRIQFIRSFSLSTDVAPARASALDRAIFGEEAQTAIDIQKPYGVAMRDGRIYVCDTRTSRVTVLDLENRQVRLMGTSGPMALNAPIDVTIADDGMIYVADRGRGIVMFTPDERPVQMFTLPEMQPLALAVHKNTLFVTNMTTQNISVLDRRSGKLLETIGTVGDEDGQFRLPLGLAADAEGNLHVVDMMRCRLQKFSAADRKVVAAVGEPTDAAGNFVRPKHIAVDREGLVYVVDSAFNNVQIFDVEGDRYRLLTSFGGPGYHPGAMDLPAGIVVLDTGLEHFKDDIHPYFDARRLIIVTNQFGPHKVAVYAMGELRPGRTLADIQGNRADLFPDTLEPGEVNPLTDVGDELPPEPEEEFQHPTGDSPHPATPPPAGEGR